jgi:hypothetical protein
MSNSKVFFLKKEVFPTFYSNFIPMFASLVSTFIFHFEFFTFHNYFSFFTFHFSLTYETLCKLPFEKGEHFWHHFNCHFIG